MSITLCERVTMQYCPDEDRLRVHVESSSEHNVFYVTARFINVLVSQWFSHPECPISEALWKEQLQKSPKEARTAAQPVTSKDKTQLAEIPPLLNTSKLRFEARRTLLQFEITEETTWVLPLQSHDSIRFLSALRQQCLIARWSLHAWPSWLQTVDAIASETATVSIH